MSRDDINVDAFDKNGWNALMWAAEQGHANVFRVLLAYKQDNPIQQIDINQTNNNGETALRYKCFNVCC